MAEPSGDPEILLAAAVADPAAAAGLDPGLRRRYGGLLAVERLLRWRALRRSQADFAAAVLARLGDAGDGRRFTRGVLARLGRRRRLAVLALAAGVLLAVGLLVLLPGSGRPADGGAVAVGAELAPASARTVALPDGSAVVLAAGSRWRWEGRGGGRLLAGAAAFSVVPQVAGSAFAVAAPHLRVTVVGTRFSLAAGADATVLRVAHGSVRARPERGPERAVAAGEALAADAAGAMSAAPLLAPGLAGWAAEAAPAALAASETGPGPGGPWAVRLALPPAPGGEDGRWGILSRAWSPGPGRWSLSARVARADGEAPRWGVLVRERDGDAWLVLGQEPPPGGGPVEVRWTSSQAPFKLLARNGDGAFDPAEVVAVGLTLSGSPGAIRVEALEAWSAPP